MSTTPAAIIYTLTDEAPRLATASLLPIVRAFAAQASVVVAVSDISLAARILAQFPERLTEQQRVPDALTGLGRLTQRPEANIIKLPNISASVAQVKAAIAELQAKGYDLPDYPDAPATDEEREVRARYARCTGSAVNPVLREGNSDRRAPQAVKNYARSHPHAMQPWSAASRTHVAWMREGGFYQTEQSTRVERSRSVRIELQREGGGVDVLREKLELSAGEIIDAMLMNKQALLDFYEQQIADARESGVLLSLHVKATMMKVSDPIIFGHCVRSYYKEAFEKHAATLAELGVNVNNGMNDLYSKIATLPQEKQDEIRADIAACEARGPALAMVDSGKGITNFHSPNDVIIDASMPAMIRAGGKMYDKNGDMQDTKALLPDATFARIYQEVINFCKTNGAFNPATMGTVPNVGLMAQKAEEYGSHDKTFEIAAAGSVRVVDNETGEVLLQTAAQAGDIWRMCCVKDAAVRDWVALAVRRARASGMPVVFWLDPYRPHEAQLIERVREYLQEHDTSGLDIQIMSQVRAMRYTLERVVRGLDTISATGNILRDYLTDLFPIMELGTSAKMLSIVPLMAGGGLYETGAGGSAPRHVTQLVQENHLRWDSLGEFLALAVSLQELGEKTGNARAALLAKTLDAATGKLLENGQGPSPKTGALDNRGSHFWLTLHWAEELAAQSEDAELAARFAPLASALQEKQGTILEEFAAVQGQPADIGGYFLPDLAKLDAIMRPSATFNQALALLGA